MATEAMGAKFNDERFWRSLPSMTDYFSPAIKPLQEYLGVGSKEMMFQVGLFLGQRAADMEPSPSAEEMLKNLVNVWERHELGHLELASLDPVTLVITDCRICGQLPGTGDMYECAFHEGFFQGALGTKLKKSVELKQETNYEGAAGTWCRRLVADLSL